MTTEEATQYRLAFARVMQRYQESRDSSGDLAAMSYGKGAEVGKATHTGASAIVQPSVSDFIVDVEVSARAVLNSGELAYWTYYYKSCRVVVDPAGVSKDEGYWSYLHTFPVEKQYAVHRLDDRIRTTLGQRFLAIQMFPMGRYDYTKANDVRSPRPKKPRWSHLY